MNDRPMFVLYDDCLDFVGLAQILQSENYPFVYSNLSKEDENKLIGRGIIDEKNYSEHFWRFVLKNKPEDVVIVTADNGSPHLFDFLRKSGYTVIGEGEFANKIEYKRSVGTKLFEDLGFNVPQTDVFDSISAAISFLEGIGRQNPKARYVVKPEGSNSAGGSRTYSGRDIADTILFLKWLKEDLEKRQETIEKIDLQAFIDGYEVDFSRWFNGEDYLPGICLDIEEKKIADGQGGGFSDGCAVNVVYYFKDSPFSQYFEKLKPYLKRVGYVGDVAINCIFDKADGQPRPLEWTPRFGWDSFPTEMLMQKATGKKVSDFLLALARKKKYELPFNIVGLGVRVDCMAPKIEKKEIQNRFYTIEDEIVENFYPYCSSKEENYYLVHENPVGVMVSVEKTFTSAVKQMYDNIMPKLFLSDAFYRSEPPKRTPEVIQFLTKHKWIS